MCNPRARRQVNASTHPQKEAIIESTTPLLRLSKATTDRPSRELELDIAFGWEMARNIADSDIGQTVVVKDRAIVAVEGMEGTDETIKRGGRLAGKGTTVVKVSRMSQDPRIDLPAVGLATVQSLVAAKSSVLCFEAGQMPFFQRQEAVCLADAQGIAIIAK